MSRIQGKDFKVVAVIPARGGSKAIPLKNIRNLGGKPLVAYTIEAALKSKTLDRIIVSTDHDRIAQISREYGAEVPFKRPTDISEDVPTELVIIHALKYLEEKEGYKTDIVVILQPTSPLRQAKDIDDAVNKLIKAGVDSVVSVCEITERPEGMIVVKEDRALPYICEDPNDPEIKMVARQELPRLHRTNGAVYVTHANRLMKTGKVISGKMQAVIMSNERSVDIDTELDLKLAELLLKELK